MRTVCVTRGKHSRLEREREGGSTRQGDYLWVTSGRPAALRTRCSSSGTPCARPNPRPACVVRDRFSSLSFSLCSRAASASATVSVSGALLDVCYSSRCCCCWRCNCCSCSAPAQQPLRRCSRRIIIGFAIKTKSAQGSIGLVQDLMGRGGRESRVVEVSAFLRAWWAQHTHTHAHTKFF